MEITSHLKRIRYLYIRLAIQYFDRHSSQRRIQANKPTHRNQVRGCRIVDFAFKAAIRQSKITHNFGIVLAEHGHDAKEATHCRTTRNTGRKVYRTFGRGIHPQLSGRLARGAEKSSDAAQGGLMPHPIIANFYPNSIINKRGILIIFGPECNTHKTAQEHLVIRQHVFSHYLGTGIARSNRDFVCDNDIFFTRNISHGRSFYKSSNTSSKGSLDCNIREFDIAHHGHRNRTGNGANRIIVRTIIACTINQDASSIYLEICQRNSANRLKKTYRLIHGRICRNSRNIAKVTYRKAIAVKLGIQQNRKWHMVCLAGIHIRCVIVFT